MLTRKGFPERFPPRHLVVRCRLRQQRPRIGTSQRTETPTLRFPAHPRSCPIPLESGGRRRTLTRRQPLRAASSFCVSCISRSPRLGFTPAHENSLAILLRLTGCRNAYEAAPPTRRVTTAGRRRLLLLWSPPIIAAIDFILGVVMLLGGYFLGAAVVIISVGIVVGWMRFWGWLRL